MIPENNRLTAPADKYPGAVVDDSTSTSKPAQATTQRGPGGGATVTAHDSRPEHARKLDEEGTWEKVQDTENEAPLNSPDEPYSLKLRRPIMTSGDGGLKHVLTLSPPRVETYARYQEFSITNSEVYENKRSGERKTRMWMETDYNRLLNHISDACGVPVIELRAMNVADVNRAAGVLLSMANGMPFR